MSVFNQLLFTIFLISTSESTSKWFPFCFKKKRRFIYTWQFCDCDLFGMVKTWPFWKGWFKWPPTSGWKGHGLNHLWYTLVNWHSNGKWTRIFQMPFPIENGDIPTSYVSLPASGFFLAQFLPTMLRWSLVVGYLLEMISGFFVDPIAGNLNGNG